MDMVKNSKSIYNLLRTFRQDQKLAQRGREIQGLVIKRGLIPKTITVRAWWKTWDSKHRWYKKSGNNYLVHDEKEATRIGDVVKLK